MRKLTSWLGSKRAQMTIWASGLRRRSCWHGCARLGGEECAVVLGNTDILGAEQVAESIRSRIAAEPIPTDAGQVPVTVSIGISGWESLGPGDAGSVERLLQQSDQALYESKAR